ncbi:MAG: EF-P lysine aminoacylase EpmA [Thiotrichaceae bacterium]
MNHIHHWQPTATLETIKLRMQLYQQVRQFFASRGVLEVETPILSEGSVPEPAIEPLFTYYHTATPKQLFLQTSPELAMKRLLAAGSGAIYQICKVFRDGKRGVGIILSLPCWNGIVHISRLRDLLDEIDALLQLLLQTSTLEQVDYCDIFEQHIDLHPLHTELAILQKYVSRFGIDGKQLDRDTCLQLILSQEIEPYLAQIHPLAIVNFPATQAALAQKHPDNPLLAERFEIYVQGIELANGFQELIDPIEQEQRFEADLVKRHALKRGVYPLDEHFLAALHVGMPPTCGVAIGLDRLLMLMTRAGHIRDVLSFSIENA